MRCRYILLLLAFTARLPAADKDGAAAVPAADLAKLYATDPAEFDKTYKGKEVTVEGGVTGITNPSPIDKNCYLILGGYTKPGEPFGVQVNCALGKGFEGVRIGHKVRVRGTCEGHSPTRSAAQLKDCTLVKVLSDDFPPSKEVAAAVEALQGKWKVTGVEGAGKLTANQLGMDEITVEGYQMTWFAGNGQKTGITGRSIEFGLAVDPKKKPKEMTLYLRPDASLPAVYEQDGDRLRLCLPLLAKDLKAAKRPTGFTAGADGMVVVTAERAK